MSFFEKRKLTIKTNENGIESVTHANVSKCSTFIECLKSDAEELDFISFIEEAVSRVENQKRVSSVFVSGCNTDPCDYIYIALDKNGEVSISNKENDPQGQLFLSFVNGFESGDYIDVCKVTLEEVDF